MRIARLIASLFMVAFASWALAGSMFSAADKDLDTAFNKALARAKSESKGGCLCKNWDQDISSLCKKDKNLEVFVCQACGSNHKGSCDSRSEEQKALDSVKKLFQ